MAPSNFRFAPSPNGLLHAGHAYSALLNATLAQEVGGTFFLRIEDIDTARCTPALEEAAYTDLHWLGLSWPQPVRRQSAHLSDYRHTLDRLRGLDVLYPCACTRGDILRATEDKRDWPRDPDGSPLYPGTCRDLPPAARENILRQPHAWRLDMRAAIARTGMLAWQEWCDGEIADVAADPLAWGDVVLGRKDIGTSYHIAVVTDDALQGITHIVRGRDLFAATSVHRVLQTLLDLPTPLYRHHNLLRDAVGDKLAKSRRSTPLRDLRADGVTALELRASLGFA